VTKLTKDEREDAFREELFGLAQKYGITVGACGCCQSPWLIFREEVDFRRDSLPDVVELGWYKEPDYEFSMEG
jgi:hypothetical protein